MIVEMPTKSDRVTSVVLKKSTVLRIKSLKQRFQYSSIEAVVTAFLDMRDKCAFSRIDLEDLARFGKIIEVEVKTATSEKEMLHNEGLDKATAHKTSESFVIEPIRIHSDISYNFTEKGPNIIGKIKKPEGAE